MTTVTLPRGLVVPVPTDATFDIYLDRHLVASGFDTEREANLELEQVRFHAMFGEALPLPGRVVTGEALSLAHAIFRLLFSTPEVQERADRALRDILSRDPPPYTVLPDGTLRVLASTARRGPSSYTIATASASVSGGDTDADLPDSYRVRESCTCPDFRTRADAHGSLCKHIAAKRILFLA